MSKDHCTGFPERWIAWRLPSSYWKLWEWWKIVDISDCCEKHDQECSSVVFLRCMKTRRAVGYTPIVAVASMVCLFRYGKI